MTAVATATVTAPSPPRVLRIPGWDNARFLCVTLVVVGHGIQPLTPDSNNALTLYLFLYSFHMPAFAIISGYFSSAEPPTRERLRRVITDLVIPYLVMEAIWSTVQFMTTGSGGFNPSKPSWTLWFLLALAIFRLVLPYLALLRWPLLLTVLGSVGVGYFDNVDSTFSLARAIGILPFFILGWKARQWAAVERWPDRGKGVWGIRLLAVAVLGVWFLVLAVPIQFWRDINLRYWFLYDDSYSGLGNEAWWAGGVRLALLVIAALLSLAFLALVPRRESWMTDLGRGTMYVYLLHSFLIYPLRGGDLLRGEHASASWLVLMIVAGVAISLVLSSQVVRRLFRPIIEPRVDWLFARRPTPTSLPPVSTHVDRSRDET